MPTRSAAPGREQNPIRAAVVGASGRLGRVAVAALESAGDFELVAEIGRGDDLERVLRESEVEVAIDATTPEAGTRHLEIYLESGIRPVIGTSGLDRGRLAGAIRRSRELRAGGLIVPNFAPGLRAVRDAIVDWASGAAGRGESAVIIETHRRGKLDRPSGTAFWLRDEAIRAAGTESIPLQIESIRLDGFVARHEFARGREGERISVVHEITQRDAFAAGVLTAARRVLDLDEWRVDLP